MARLGPWRRDMSSPLHALQSELNRMFEEYWNPGKFAAGQVPPMDLERASWSPVVDLVESADAYVLSAEVPGVDPATIDLSITGNVLTLRGVKPADDAFEPAGLLHERRYGPFHRQVVLNGVVNLDSAQAEARNGVLTIRLPKQESAKPRTIPVNPV